MQAPQYKPQHQDPMFMMMLMNALRERQKPQAGQSSGGGIPPSLAAAAGTKLASLFGGGQAAAPALAGMNAPAAPVLANALSSGGGLSAGSTGAGSSLAGFGAYAGPLAVLATAPIWAPKVGSKLTSFFKGKDNDRRFDVDEVTSSLKDGGMTQFQKAVPGWDKRSGDERKSIAQQAYDLKVLNLIGDPQEDMGLMGDARNQNSEQLHIGSKLMTPSKKWGRGEESKWQIQKEMERIPTSDEILSTGSLKKDYREKLAEFASMLSSQSPVSASPGQSIDPGRIPGNVQQLTPTLEGVGQIDLGGLDELMSKINSTYSAPRSETSSPGIRKDGSRIDYSKRKR